MLRLLLLRHAKSDWHTESDHDHERPLASRGERDAIRIGRFLTAAGLRPELVLCSTAIRARRTVELRFLVSPKLLRHLVSAD